MLANGINERLESWIDEINDVIHKSPLDNFTKEISKMAIAIKRYSLSDAKKETVKSFLDKCEKMLASVQRRIEIISKQKTIDDFIKYKQTFYVWADSCSNLIDYFGEEYSEYWVYLYNYQLALFECGLIFESDIEINKEGLHEVESIINHSSIELYRATPGESLYCSLVFVLLNAHLLKGDMSAMINDFQEAVHSYRLLNMIAYLLPKEELRYEILHQVYAGMAKAALIITKTNDEFKEDMFLHHYVRKYKWDIDHGKQYIVPAIPVGLI